ncbi:MAG: peptidoglycan-binding protein [Actinomycetales bacterium]|nr:peptidoglycan-binding protein [Actinomycetales bacterium]
MARMSRRTRISRLAALGVAGAMIFGGTAVTAPAADASQIYTCVRPSGTAPLLVQGAANSTAWVKYAQCQLNNSMLDADPTSSAVNLVVDGSFGSKTKASVVKFQNCVHINPDGKIGVNTWTALAYWNSRSGFAC